MKVPGWKQLAVGFCILFGLVLVVGSLGCESSKKGGSVVVKSGSYTTRNPSMSGNCHGLMLMLGCSSASRCSIIGTAGDIEVSVKGSEATVRIRGGGSSEWTTYTGTQTDSGFVGTMSMSESADGCAMSIEGSLTTADVTQDQFNGVIELRIVISGDCFGLNANCTTRAEISATLVPGKFDERRQAGGISTVSAPLDKVSASLLNLWELK